MKKILSFIMAVSMLTLPLTSCRKGGDTDIPAPEMQTVDHVYRGDYISIPEDINPETDSTVFVDNSVIFPAYQQIKIPGKEETYEHRRILYSIPLDGGEAAITPLVQKLQIADRETEYAYIGNVAIGTDGSYAVFEAKYNNKNDDRNYLITVYGADGTEKLSVNPEPMNEIRSGRYADDGFAMGGSSFYIQRIALSGDGKLYFATEFSVVAVSESGERMYEVPVDGYVESLTPTADGRMLFSWRSYSSWENQLCYMDDEKKNFSEPIALPSISFDDFEVYLGEGYDYYLKTAAGLYGLNQADSTPTLLCSWINSDINPNAIRRLQIVNADTVLYIGTDPITYTAELALLRRVPEEELQPRYLIRIAGEYFDYDFTGHVVKFNRQSDTYRLTLENYGEYNTPEDHTLGAKKLEEDILAGNVPDILYAGGYNDSFANYADKGVFTDLYTLMDADENFDRSTLMPCVLAPFERDGKLYQLAASFAIAGFAGKTKNVGQYADTWTLDTLLRLMDECEKNGKKLYGEIYRENMEELLITYALPSYIDYENAVCDFTSDTFLRTLEFLKKLPTQQQYYDGYDYSAARQENAAVLRDDKTLLTDLNMYSFSEYLQAKSMMLMEDIAVLGIPTDTGGALAIDGLTTFAIAEKSPLKDGAWEFVKFILNAVGESGRAGGRGFPATRAGMQAMAEKELKMYYVFSLDGSGWGGTEWDGITPPDWEYDPEKEIPGYLTQADVDTLIALFENSDFLSTLNAGAEEKLSALISEELGAFYAGNATAEATADKIQSRVSIYLSEKS